MTIVAATKLPQPQTRNKTISSKYILFNLMKKAGMKQINLLVLNTAPLQRKLIEIFRADNNVLKVLQADDTKKAFDIVNTTSVDITFCPSRLPNSNIVDFMEKSHLCSKTKIIIVGGNGESSLNLLKMFHLGIKGYLSVYDINPSTVFQAICRVWIGGLFLPCHLDRKQENQHDYDEDLSKETLTPREDAIINLISTGMKNRDIAKLLSIKEKTVKNHINNIYSKMAISNRYEAISLILNENFA